MSNRWTIERANDWYADQPWLVGCNFTPSTASNQLEMWQAETFDPETIERELRWASEIGMNTVRVFLHDLVWEDDAKGFKKRIDRFLAIADSVGIRTMLVLFDDCWYPPVPGPQADPVPGVHNSRWAQSPGHRVVKDRSQWPRLEAYVKDVVQSFGQDGRVCIWDLYNEPGNAFLPLAATRGARRNVLAIWRAIRHLILPSPTVALLRATFEWARSVDPIQPLTAGLWVPNLWLNRLQLAESDVISFHQYESQRRLEERIEALQTEHGRPVLCTEWMARAHKSRFETHLPVFKVQGVGCYCWGLVSGRTQTIHPWEDLPGSGPPDLWHHDVLRPDGTPYDETDIKALRDATQGVKNLS